MVNAYAGRMANLSTTTVTVFTRHTGKCPKRKDRFWKRCNCRKSLYIYEDGKVTNISAKTRSWEQAEKAADAERDKRDPVKIELARIAVREAQEACLQKGKNITVPEATDRWVRSEKIAEGATLRIYMRAAWRIEQWAADEGIINVRDITADVLDKWRGMWSPTAEKPYNKMGPTSQSLFQGRVKQFCGWCVGTGNLDRDPTAFLKSITKSKEQTQPITLDQFQQLLDAIEPYTKTIAIGDARGYAKELKALFLTQVWTGLRILDVLMLPRTALVGNRLSLITKKTGAKIENRTVPDCVVEALLDLSPVRPTFRPEYFLWSVGKKWEGLSSKWDALIKPMNKLLAFKGDRGQPLTFKSHMLRDTFAVEMLLAGVPLEDVSKLLTHTSIKTTEKHYAPWVKPRLQQLDDKAVAAMRLLGTKVSK